MTAVFWSGVGLVLATTLLGGTGQSSDDAHAPQAPAAVSASPSDP
ncbi:class F sortase, partial [Streptomyces sp. SID7804]|nr:class F sortase [Streptomyces sp. SID7804]